MTDDININFPAVVDGRIGGEVVQTVDARDLHACLKQGMKTGQDFSNWIKGQLEKYGFVENQDYAAFAEISDQVYQGVKTRKEYALTLDTAKEIAMVDGS